MELEQCWHQVVSALERTMPARDRRAWLGLTRLLATVGVPDTFTAELLDQRYRDTIARCLRSLVGRAVTVMFAVIAPPATPIGGPRG